MDPFTAMMVIGGGLQIIGGVKTSQAEARAAESNAEFFDLQSSFTREIGEKRRRVFRNESDVQLGRIQSTLARAGVSLTGGDVARQIIQESMKTRREEIDMARQTEMEATILGSKAGAARRRASDTRKNIPFQVAGGILGTAGSILGGR